METGARCLFTIPDNSVQAQNGEWFTVTLDKSWRAITSIKGQFDIAYELIMLFMMRSDLLNKYTLRKNYRLYFTQLRLNLYEK